jgi:hypothetical protein
VGDGSDAVSSPSAAGEPHEVCGRKGRRLPLGAADVSRVSGVLVCSRAVGARSGGAAQARALFGARRAIISSISSMRSSIEPPWRSVSDDGAPLAKCSLAWA